MGESIDRFGKYSDLVWGQVTLDRYNMLSVTATATRDIASKNKPFDPAMLSTRNAPAADVPCVQVTALHEGGMAKYTYHYDGLPTWAKDGEVFCELEGTDNHEPIETNINWKLLSTKYKAVPVNGTDRFDYFRKFLKGDGDSKILNPLYGTTEYLACGWVWRRTSIVRQLPQLSSAETISYPVGDADNGVVPPQLGGKRNWLKLAPSARWRGNAWQLVETWMASGRNGWNRDLYGGGGVVDADGGGLSTGRL